MEYFLSNRENICPKYAEDGGDYFMHTFDKGAVCDICKKLFKWDIFLL